MGLTHCLFRSCPSLLLPRFLRQDTSAHRVDHSDSIKDTGGRGDGGDSGLSVTAMPGATSPDMYSVVRKESPREWRLCTISTVGHRWAFAYVMKEKSQVLPVLRAPRCHAYQLVKETAALSRAGSREERTTRREQERRGKDVCRPAVKNNRRSRRGKAKKDDG